MDIFPNVIDYIETAKPGDIIVLGGSGILSGLKPEFKHETYKVLQAEKPCSLLFRAYGAKAKLRTSIVDQPVGLLSRAEYQALKT